MRVLHIVKAVQVAGAERHLLSLLPGLRERDIDARLIVLVEPDKPMDDYLGMLAARSVPVDRLTIPRDFAPGLVPRLRRSIRQIQPDIVHTHLLHADLYGIPAARWSGVPVVISSRHNDNAFRRRAPFKQINRFLWRLTDAGITISDSLTRFTIEVEGASPSKIHRIYYGLDAGKSLDKRAARATLLGELGLPQDALLIGTVCRLTEQKGITYGLQAFARIAADFPTAHLLIAGDGLLRPSLETQSAALGLTERVHFLGWREDVPALMAAFDIFLVPSLWEGFGLVLLEAMAQSTPIIASRVSAIPEIVVDGETGLLVPPRDVDALADSLSRLLSDSALRGHMGLLGQDRLETHFGAPRMVDETAALYQQLLDYRWGT